jgi:hypothetical protein
MAAREVDAAFGDDPKLYAALPPHDLDARRPTLTAAPRHDIVAFPPRKPDNGCVSPRVVRVDPCVWAT